MLELTSPAHRPALHRRRPPRPAPGRVPLGGVPVRRRRREDLPAADDVRLGRHTGPGHPLGHLQAVPTIAEQLEDPRRNSADKTKRRVLEAHDSIWLLAAREYGEPRYWRLIARHNDVDDPRRIPPGTVLVLPPIDADEGVPSATRPA